MNHTLKQLNRLRWSVLVVVIAGIGASVAMNVMHAPDSWWARGVAGVPPLAVYAGLEMIVRIPSSGKWLTFIRIAGAFAIATGAAAISYAQQKAAVQALGFAEWESYIWPTIIDGLMIVASVSLVEVVRLIRNVTNGLTMHDGAPLPAGPRAVAPQAQVEESAEVLEYRAAMARRRTEGALVGLNVKSKAVK